MVFWGNGAFMGLMDVLFVEYGMKVRGIWGKQRYINDSVGIVVLRGFVVFLCFIFILLFNVIFLLH